MKQEIGKRIAYGLTAVIGVMFVVNVMSLVQEKASGEPEATFVKRELTAEERERIRQQEIAWEERERQPQVLSKEQRERIRQRAREVVAAGPEKQELRSVQLTVYNRSLVFAGIENPTRAECWTLVAGFLKDADVPCIVKRVPEGTEVTVRAQAGKKAAVRLFYR